MLVAVTGFGSIWRRRFGKDPGDPHRFVQAAYYNTTGVEIAGTIRQRPQITGYARFHGRGGFNPNYPSRMINRVFECTDPCVWMGVNKLLFRRMLNTPAEPDAFLVVVRPELTGTLKVSSDHWRSAETWLIAFSESRGQQEAMLLMPAFSWIQSELGLFVLEPEARRPWVARLVLRSLQQE